MGEGSQAPAAVGTADEAGDQGGARRPGGGADHLAGTGADQLSMAGVLAVVDLGQLPVHGDLGDMRDHVARSGLVLSPVGGHLGKDLA